MRGVNKVILLGTLGRDPEIRYSQGGNPIATLSLATNESYKDRSTGQNVPKTEWHRVIVITKAAEFLGQYAKKGAAVYIEGKNQTRKWQGEDGSDRFITEVVVDMKGVVELVANKGSEGSQEASGGSGQAGAAGNPQQPANEGAAYQQSGTSPSGYVPGSGYAQAQEAADDPLGDRDIPF